MLDVDGQDADAEQAGRPTRLPQLHIRVAQVTGAPVVILTGEIDLATVDKLRACLDALEGRIVVDLYAVPFLDSSGLAVFVATRKRLLQRGGELRLRSPQDQVRRVLELTGLDVMIMGHPVRADSGPAA